MTESSLRSISLFFFFAALEERYVVSASQQAARAFKHALATEPDQTESVHLVRSTFEAWERIRHVAGRTTLHFLPGPRWSLPRKTSLGPWREFHKHATDDELPIMIWCQILGLSERDVAAALELPEGTVRHRLGRALRKLGGMV